MSKRLENRARLPTNSDFRVNYELRLDGLYDRQYGQCFGYAAYVLLSPHVNAIILETASSVVCPDYVCSLVYVFYPVFVCTCLHSTYPRPTKRPYDYERVLMSPYELPAVSIIASPRVTTLYYTGIPGLPAWNGTSTIYEVSNDKLLLTICYYEDVTTLLLTKNLR